MIDDWDKAAQPSYYRMDEYDNEFDVDQYAAGSTDMLSQTSSGSQTETPTPTPAPTTMTKRSCRSWIRRRPREHTEKLYAVYSKAKKAWRRHVAKPTRKFRRGLRRNFGKRFSPKNSAANPERTSTPIFSISAPRTSTPSTIGEKGQGQGQGQDQTLLWQVERQRHWAQTESDRKRWQAHAVQHMSIRAALPC